LDDTPANANAAFAGDPAPGSFAGYTFRESGLAEGVNL
jgi:hypothetical protein